MQGIDCSKHIESGSIFYNAETKDEVINETALSDKISCNQEAMLKIKFMKRKTSASTCKDVLAGRNSIFRYLSADSYLSCSLHSHFTLVDNFHWSARVHDETRSAGGFKNRPAGISRPI